MTPGAQLPDGMLLVSVPAQLAGHVSAGPPSFPPLQDMDAMANRGKEAKPPRPPYKEMRGSYFFLEDFFLFSAVGQAHWSQTGHLSRYCVPIQCLGTSSTTFQEVETMDAASLINSGKAVGSPGPRIDVNDRLVTEDRHREVLEALDRARDLLLGLPLGEPGQGRLQKDDDLLQVADDASGHALLPAAKLLLANDEGYESLHASLGAAIVMLWAWKVTGDDDYRKFAKNMITGSIGQDNVRDSPCLPNP